MYLQSKGFLNYLLVLFIGSCSVNALDPGTKHNNGTEKQDYKERLIFEQPEVGIGDIEGRVFVKERRPVERWFMISWQESPFIEGGKPFVPVDWDPVEKTGFSIPGNRALNQRGYRNEAGTTMCQIYGGTVGAYLNSANLSIDGSDDMGNPLPGSGGYKQGFFPSYHFSDEEPIYLWREQNSRIEISLELQIPTAECAEKKGSLSYTNPLLLLVDPRTNIKISWGPMLFSKRSHGDHTKPLQNIALDVPSNSWMIRDRLVTGASYLEPAPGSALFQNVPWRGFKRFAWTVSRYHVEKALKAMHEQEPGLQMSLDPGDYYLAHFHLNAETHYQTAPAELGWSMRNLRIVLIHP